MYRLRPDLLRANLRTSVINRTLYKHKRYGTNAYDITFNSHGKAVNWDDVLKIKLPSNHNDKDRLLALFPAITVHGISVLNQSHDLRIDSYMTNRFNYDFMIATTALYPHAIKYDRTGKLDIWSKIPPTVDNKVRLMELISGRAKRVLIKLEMGIPL